MSATRIDQVVNLGRLGLNAIEHPGIPSCSRVRNSSPSGWSIQLKRQSSFGKLWRAP